MNPYYLDNKPKNIGKRKNCKNSYERFYGSVYNLDQEEGVFDYSGNALMHQKPAYRNWRQVGSYWECPYCEFGMSEITGTIEGDYKEFTFCPNCAKQVKDFPRPERKSR